MVTNFTFCFWGISISLSIKKNQSKSVRGMNNFGANRKSNWLPFQIFPDCRNSVSNYWKENVSWVKLVEEKVNLKRSRQKLITNTAANYITDIFSVISLLRCCSINQIKICFPCPLVNLFSMSACQHMEAVSAIHITDCQSHLCSRI